MSICEDGKLRDNPGINDIIKKGGQILLTWHHDATVTFNSRHRLYDEIESLLKHRWVSTGDRLPDKQEGGMKKGEVLLDRNGDALEYGKIYTTEALSVTPKVTFSDPECTIANPNPIILTKDGMVPGDVFFDGDYDIVISDQDNEYQYLHRYMENKNIWISVDHGLPSRGGKYLVFMPSPQKDESIVIASYYGNGKWYDHEWNLYVEPSHWRFMPEPPEAIK